MSDVKITNEVNEVDPFYPESIQDLYRKEYKNGHTVYTKYGERNLREFVNSFRDGCSLKAILERNSLCAPHAMIQSVQNVQPGVSADISGMPKDGTAAYMMLANINQSYPGLLKDIHAGVSVDNVVKKYFANDTNSSEESEVTPNE